MPSSETKTADEKLIAEAKKRFEICEDAERDIRDLALDDLRFYAGEHWPEVIKRERELSNRPCLTIDRIGGAVKQVVNDQRQNRPAVHVNPVDDNADPDTAEVLQGLVRHIEYDSSADVAYDTAFQYAAITGGPGYIRVITEYEYEDSTEQCIKIKRIRNPRSVYLDPNATEPDGSDAEFGFIFTWLTKEEYEREYPAKEDGGPKEINWESDIQGSDGWLKDNDIRVAEYFYRVREGKKSVVKWCKFNGFEVLEETEWPGKWIPIVPVIGEEIDINGKRVLRGIVRMAKDPQRMYDFQVSNEAETIALAPKAPFVGWKGQFEDPKWQTANARNWAYLEAEPVLVDGQTAPSLPQRNIQEPPIAAITQARMAAADDVKVVTGIYDASLGAKGNETSGKAIMARQREGDTANFHLIDNFSKALRHVGRIVVDLIPKIYNAERVVRIIGEDGTQKTVTVNAQENPMEPVENIYDLTIGKYDVTVTTGPSYSTKRQEAAESMIEMTRAYPDLFAIAGDLLVKNLDWPGSKELSERLKKKFGIEDEDSAQMPIPPQVQQQMAEMEQKFQQMNEYARQTQQENEAYKAGLQVEQMREQFKTQIEMAKIELERERMQQEALKLNAQLDSQEAIALLKAEVDALKNQMSMDMQAAAQEADAAADKIAE
jgi:hypothetical protein